MGLWVIGNTVWASWFCWPEVHALGQIWIEWVCRV